MVSIKSVFKFIKAELKWAWYKDRTETEVWRFPHCDNLIRFLDIKEDEEDVERTIVVLTPDEWKLAEPVLTDLFHKEG